MKVVSINKNPKENSTRAWALLLIEKWTRKDKEEAQKKYGHLNNSLNAKNGHTERG